MTKHGERWAAIYGLTIGTGLVLDAVSSLMQFGLLHPAVIAICGLESVLGICFWSFGVWRVVLLEGYLADSKKR